MSWGGVGGKRTGGVGREKDSRGLHNYMTDRQNERKIEVRKQRKKWGTIIKYKILHTTFLQRNNDKQEIQRTH